MPLKNRLGARPSYLFETLRMLESFLSLYGWLFPFGRLFKDGMQRMALFWFRGVGKGFS